MMEALSPVVGAPPPLPPPRRSEPSLPSAFSGLVGAIAAPPPLAAPAPASSPRPSVRATPGREVVELIGFDPAVLPLLRAEPRWSAVLASLMPAPSSARGELPAETSARRELAALLTRIDPATADALDEAIAQAVSEEGLFTPPLVLLEGELHFAFDPLEAKRALPAGALDAQVTRALLEQRCYERRTIFGEARLRALLSLGDGAPALPAYLPEALATQLPMFQRLRVRMIAEAHLPQDENDPGATALRVMALGRSVPRPGKR